MDLVITPSEYVATELRGMGVSQARVIVNAVDLRAFSPA